MVWYSHVLKNFQQFVVMFRDKSFGVINKALLSNTNRNPSDAGVETVQLVADGRAQRKCRASQTEGGGSHLSQVWASADCC